MKAGDLVKHKRTGAVGILIEVLESYADDVYNIRWMNNIGTYNSHFVKELEVISEKK